MRAAETEVTAIKLPLVRVCDADYKRRQDKENCSEHTLNVTGADGVVSPAPSPPCRANTPAARRRRAAPLIEF